MSKPRFLIGIDPGAQTGLAIYDRQQKKLVELRTTDFWNAYGFVTLHDEKRVEVFIENPGLIRRPVYQRLSGESGANRREKVASNIGENRREAELLIQGIKARGFNVREIKPTQKKMDAKDFKRITGYVGSTNQHVRDAGMLVFGF
jgi:hypothetical protein